MRPSLAGGTFLYPGLRGGARAARRTVWRHPQPLQSRSSVNLRFTARILGHETPKVELTLALVASGQAASIHARPSYWPRPTRPTVCARRLQSSVGFLGSRLASVRRLAATTPDWHLRLQQSVAAGPPSPRTARHRAATKRTRPHPSGRARRHDCIGTGNSMPWLRKTTMMAPVWVLE